MLFSASASCISAEFIVETISKPESGASAANSVPLCALSSKITKSRSTSLVHQSSTPVQHTGLSKVVVVVVGHLSVSQEFCHLLDGQN